MITGTVFSIEDFAINDGPGIRTTVFLKGCPLRCVWCHNPEGLSAEPQIVHKSFGDEMCGRRVSSEELAAELLRSKSFFEMNGGGVTFTGGEPTMQSAFLCDVLERLEGVHRAVETCGYCGSEVFERVLSRLEMVLFDIKLVDPILHEKYTGRDNAPILKNLETLKRSGRRFVARIPLIPGVNDSLENMKATYELIKDAPALDRVELLRYHKTAGAKYSMVGMKYDPPFDTDAQPEIHEVFGNLNLLIL